MNRIFHHFELWEDWQAGMYTGGTTEEATAAAREVLASPSELLDSMTYVATEWCHAAEFNLSNTGRNRRAWLGQAACCFAVGANEASTKTAWWQLSKTQQLDANLVADRVIDQWQMNFEKGVRLF